MTKENPTQLWQRRLSRRRLLTSAAIGGAGLAAAVLGCEGESLTAAEKLVHTFDSIFSQLKNSNIDGVKSREWPNFAGEPDLLEYKFQDYLNGRLYVLRVTKSQEALSPKFLEIYERDRYTIYFLLPYRRPDRVIKRIEEAPLIIGTVDLGNKIVNQDSEDLYGWRDYSRHPYGSGPQEILKAKQVSSLSKELQEAFNRWQEGNKFGK